MAFDIDIEENNLHFYSLIHPFMMSLIGEMCGVLNGVKGVLMAHNWQK